MNTDEYNADEEDQDVLTDEATSAKAPTARVKDEDEIMGPPLPGNPQFKEEELDPELAEWFKVDSEVPDSPRWQEDADDDSVTEDDSDNEDVAGEPEVDADDWQVVKHEDNDQDVAISGDVKGKAPEVCVKFVCREALSLMHYIC